MSKQNKANTIISITGTKGKTNLARLLEYVLAPYYPSIVRVETTGAYLNGVLRYSDEDSRAIWGYTSTNVPGRFIALHNAKSGISILETTLFSARTGLGYKFHDVGIFTNVYEDHIGSFSYIKTPQDIANMKSFVFSKLKSNGWAIYNADDELVCGALTKLPQAANLIAVSVSKQTPPSNATYLCHYDQKEGVLRLIGSHNKCLLKISLCNLKWLLNDHVPSIYLTLFTLATLYAILPKSAHNAAVKRLCGYSIDPSGGRTVVMPLENGAKAILDFAHEEISLKEIAKYARSLCGEGGKVIGVLRFAPSRTHERLVKIAEAIYDSFDEFVIYDKVDGYYRLPQTVKGYNKKQEKVGYIASVFSKEVQKLGSKPVHKIIREDEAIRAAIKISSAADVIVYIVGDDASKSREFVKSTYTRNET